MSRVLLAHNPLYWPAAGGSERVLQHILEGLSGDFEQVVVFAKNAPERFEHNGVDVRPYRLAELRRFALRERPDVYFPNMVHNRITQRNIAFVSHCSRRTVLNMIGGYLPGTPLPRRLHLMRRATRHADAVVHVDPLSTEWLVDQTLLPGLPVVFIPQGLDLDEICEVRTDEADDYFVYAHNFWHWKQPEVFIREIAARAPELRFKMIASDRTGNVVAETIAEAARVPNIEVLLGLPRREFIDVMAHAAGVISTSSAEGAQPNIMLEAGALGVPYLSLCPGQNYGHYDHVEMFEDPGALLERVRGAGTGLRNDKRAELARARARFGQDQYSWASVIEQFRGLFLGPLPSRPPHVGSLDHMWSRLRRRAARWLS